MAVRHVSRALPHWAPLQVCIASKLITVTVTVTVSDHYNKLLQILVHGYLSHETSMLQGRGDWVR